MITGSENEELLFVLIPVGAKPSKHRGSIIQRVCKDADLRLGIRDDTAAKECILGFHLSAHLDHLDQKSTIAATGAGFGR